MSRKSVEHIVIPKAELVDVSEIKVDGQNPNRMTEKQHERLKTSFIKYGFIVPIITNKDLVVADGEQRLIVARELKMPKVLVIRLPVEDVDRRLLRQVLNKLRGEHDLVADAEEFERIIKLGRKDDLKHLLDLDEKQLERALKELQDEVEEEVSVRELYEVIIECSDEEHQKEVFKEIKGLGHKCRVLIL